MPWWQWTWRREAPALSNLRGGNARKLRRFEIKSRAARRMHCLLGHSIVWLSISIKSSRWVPYLPVIPMQAPEEKARGITINAAHGMDAQGSIPLSWCIAACLFHPQICWCGWSILAWFASYSTEPFPWNTQVLGLFTDVACISLGVVPHQRGLQ